jgi:hypothetical protein
MFFEQMFIGGGGFHAVTGEAMSASHTEQGANFVLFILGRCRDLAEGNQGEGRIPSVQFSVADAQQALVLFVWGRNGWHRRRPCGRQRCVRFVMGCFRRGRRDDRRGKQRG